MQHLIDALSSPSEEDRLYAVQDMGAGSPEEFCRPLIDHLCHETSVAVKETIVFHLRRMFCSDDYSHLFSLFRSSDAYLRNAAVSIFGAGRDEAIAFLTANLDDADREVRKLILDALYVCGTPEAVLAIRACLHDPSVNVKITAVEYLGQLGDRESAGEMIQFLIHDAEPMLRTAVLESLPLVADPDDIDNVLSLLVPAGNWGRVDPLILPEIIRLGSRAADADSVARILAVVSDSPGYAEDVLAAIGETDHRFPGFVRRPAITGCLVSLLQQGDIPERIRYACSGLILSRDVCDPPELERLGIQLSEDAVMTEAGLRFLCAAGTRTARETIENLVADPKNAHLRRIYDEMEITPSTDHHPEYSDAIGGK